MTLLIEQEWELLNAENPKYRRMLERRARILKNLAGYRREISLLELLIERYSLQQSSAPRARDQTRILDAACGMGFQILELASRGLQVTGLEIDPNLCALGDQAAQQFRVPAIFQVGDACAIPFAGDYFDVVMSKNFFEHVYNPDLALAEQVRVLKPGGYLIIIDGNLLYPKTLFNLFIVYALRTRGKRGGMNWLLTKSRVQKNLYGYLPLGKDEDVKTPGWWRHYIGQQTSLRLVKSTGEHAILNERRYPSPFHDWLGACTVVAQKV